MATLAKIISPATEVTMFPTEGLEPVVELMPVSSRTDIYPDCALPVAATAMSATPPPLGIEISKDDPVGGASKYHNSARHSVTPAADSACVNATLL